jgi:hypothetical protein
MIVTNPNDLMLVESQILNALGKEFVIEDGKITGIVGAGE